MKKYLASFRYEDEKGKCYGEVGFCTDKLTISKINELRNEVIEEMNEKENKGRVASKLVFLSFTELEED